MSMLHWLLAATLAAAQNAPDAAAPEFDLRATAGKTLTKEQSDKIIATCGVRRFQTSATRVEQGKTRQTKITLCAADSESEAAWIAKLEQSAISVETLNLPDAAKSKLIGDLRTEIARVKALQPIAPAEPVRTAGATPQQPLLLPPLPLPVPTRRTRSLAQDFAALPPLPPPMPIASMAAARPAVVSPNLTIRCVNPSEGQNEAECGGLTKETIVVVRAGAPLASNYVMRFMRKDRPRGDVPLAGLRGARTMRVKLPSQICAGVVRSEVTIQVMANATTGLAQVAQSFRPMGLHC